MFFKNYIAMKKLEENKHILIAVKIIFEKKLLKNKWQSHEWEIHDLVLMDMKSGDGYPPINNVEILPLRNFDEESNFPDFATIHIQYVPKERIVELKSLKLYINRFRNEEHFHEEVVNLILDDFLICCEPKWVKIEGDFNVRGNIKTKVRVINGVKPPNCD